MSYLDEAAQDMAESFKRIFITAFGHGYDFGCESKEGELKRLRADNAKLREEVVDLRKSSQTYESENAELRELVRKVLQFERAGCEGCPYASTCDVDCLYEPNCPMREDIERDMRELEVDACPNCGAKVVEPTTNDVDAEVDG